MGVNTCICVNNQEQVNINHYQMIYYSTLLFTAYNETISVVCLHKGNYFPSNVSSMVFWFVSVKEAWRLKHEMST